MPENNNSLLYTPPQNLAVLRALLAQHFLLLLVFENRKELNLTFDNPKKYLNK